MRSAESDFEGEIFIPVYTESEKENLILHTEIPFYDALLKQFPLSESYYLHIYVTDYRNDVPYAEAYALWKHGEKYRIHRYNESEELQSVIICDGEFAHIADYVEETEKYCLKKDGYEFRNISPLPDFSQLLRLEHELVSYSEEDGFCTVIYEYPEFHTIDAVKVDKSNGLPYSYVQKINGKTVRTVNVLTADASLVFDEEMFRVLQKQECENDGEDGTGIPVILFEQ